MRSLIINADDWGLSDGVCAGIVEAWRAGVVTSTSALINIEGAAARVAAASASAPELPIGLHINLTLGRPVLPPERVSSLVDGAGRFFSLPAILEHLPAIDPEHVRAELWAQAERFTACGVSFDHLDFHHHLPALHAPFFAIACDLARAYGVPMRRPRPMRMPGAHTTVDLRHAADLVAQYWPLSRQPRHALRLAQQALTLVYGHDFDQLRESGIVTPARFVVGFGHTTTLYAIGRLLRALPDGVSELMVHPGLADRTADSLDEMPPAFRAGELALLLNPDFRRLIDAEDIRLVSFGALHNERMKDQG